jgi:hypothetical protein
MSESSDETPSVGISDEQLPEDLQPEEDPLSEEEKPDDPLPEG